MIMKMSDVIFVDDFRPYVLQKRKELISSTSQATLNNIIIKENV